MSELPAPPPAPSPAPALTGWRKALYVFGISAAVLRVLLIFLRAGPAPASGWPVREGSVIALQPGDKALARWGESPGSDPFQVSKVIPGGEPALPNTRVCLFAPDYAADASQPGGTLTVLGRDLLVGWRVHWSGGDTMPPEAKQPDFDGNCGRDADLLFTATQLHDLINILAGLPPPPPEPGVPAGTEISLPIK